MSITRPLCAALFAALSTGCLAADPTQIDRNVRALDEQSISLLGISLYELRYLLSLKPNTFHDVEHLERSFDITVIRRLESKGFVRTEVRTLPGAEKDLFLRVIPIDVGAEIQRSVESLQHDSAPQPTR